MPVVTRSSSRNIGNVGNVGNRDHEISREIEINHHATINIVDHTNHSNDLEQNITQDTSSHPLAGGGAAAAATASASLGLGYCSICCDDIQFDKGRFVLECGHTFHSKCILTAFQHGNRCPMCRTEVKESEAHRSYIMPSSLRIYSSILNDAADHFIQDLGNITLANVVHRMLLMSSENQDMRSIQYDYIKRLLVQFASMFVRGIAFSSVRDGETEVQDPVPIEIIDSTAAAVADADRSIQDREYDAALSNPALDAAVAYQAIVSADLDFDSQQGTDNVSSVLIRRSVALAELGVQRADVSLRRARVLALRREQMQEVQRLLQRAQAAAQTSDVTNESTENVNMVISESSSQDNHDDNGDDQNPWGLEF
jgi:hypothetical protein